MVQVPDSGAIENGDRERSTVRGEWQGEEGEFYARRVIVKLARPQAPPESDRAARALDAAREEICGEVPGGRMLRSRRPSRRMVMEIDAGESVEDWATRLSDRDDVEYAEPDVVDREALVPDDPRYGGQWSPDAVNAEDAWDIETGNPSGVVMGIVDSGISMTGGDLDHPELSDESRVVLGTDFVDGGTPRDTRGHGTHVAGIAGAVGDNATGIAGMDWASLLYVCRTLDANGRGSSADFADAVEEITDYALANGLNAVINYSAGGAANRTKEEACQYASDNGMLVVAATGNDDAGPVIAPASYSTSISGVIAVGSTDEDGTVSGFSNVGPEVTVVAPGADILSTMPTYDVTLPRGPDYGELSGTSMATPLVTGLCSLVWSNAPSFTNEKVKECITDTAVPLGSSDFDEDWGHGQVDAEAALKCGERFGPVRTLVATTCPTTVGPSCPGNLSRLMPRCPSTNIDPICGRTRLSPRCPDPVSRIGFCGGEPSRLPNLCPTSRFDPDCRLSWVDACPSALRPNCGGVRGGPGRPVDPLRPGGGPPGRGPGGPGLDPGATVGEDEEVWYDASGRFWWTQPRDDDEE